MILFSLSDESPQQGNLIPSGGASDNRAGGPLTDFVQQLEDYAPTVSSKINNH